MSILCYVTFNDGGSVLKSVLVNGDQCSPRRAPVWPGAQLHNRGPGHPSRAAHNSENYLPLRSSSTTCSPNLFKQIKSTLLFHLTFIWRATPPLSLCFLLVLCVSFSPRRTARLISGLHRPERTMESQSSSIKFLIILLNNLVRVVIIYNVTLPTYHAPKT